MAQRKPFLLRIDTTLLDEIQRWANDDLRSLNGQIEFLLRRALAESKRRKLPESSTSPEELSGPPPEASDGESKKAE